ncbi:MAG TPA: 3-phosphoshikimate 1-carboxyvinyltransferase [bacterium]|nr:3-phosphoshikimate 1-carboxyvinyltransferase [bacterium]
MKYIVRKSKLSGSADIPGSKSHTIRALFFAALAAGESQIRQPLDSADTSAATSVCKSLGAGISFSGGDIKVNGLDGAIKGVRAEIDTLNSGTSMSIGIGAAAIAKNSDITLTGDAQVRKRPVGELVSALNNLGSDAACVTGNNCPPVRITSPIKGGKTALRAFSSQYLTSLLMCAPFADGDTEIEVVELLEKPYVDMTLWWMNKLGLSFDRDGYANFRIHGGQRVKGFTQRIPVDFSSATFFAAGAAMTQSEIVLGGLDLDDVQGDKAVLSILSAMGAETLQVEGGVSIQGRGLKGAEFDLNDTPDALPALAAAACAADGTTRLVNVPQARIKETDRIAVMKSELSKMGADIQELPDGLVIRGSALKGATVDGHSDHRVVMALALAGLVAEGETIITTAESVAVTFPNFADLMIKCGADITIEQ